MILTPIGGPTAKGPRGLESAPPSAAGMHGYRKMEILTPGKPAYSKNLLLKMMVKVKFLNFKCLLLTTFWTLGSTEGCLEPSRVFLLVSEDEVLERSQG